MTSDELLKQLEGGIDTFHINPLGGDNIVVEGSDRFAHERDVKVLNDAAKQAAARIRELESALKLIMAGGSHSEGMQWREHDLSQVRTIAAAALSGDFRAAKRPQNKTVSD